MFDPTLISDLARRLSNAAPPELQFLKADMEKAFVAILQASLSRMNLVSREEFDVQREVLARTRVQLEALEARVAELERQVLNRE